MQRVDLILGGMQFFQVNLLWYDNFGQPNNKKEET